MPIIDFKATMCKHCYKCVRGCEVKSIMIRDGHAYIMPNRCILCGQCLLNCPQSAKRVPSELSKVKKLIESGAPVIASLSSSYMGVLPYKKRGQVKSALKKLGFTNVCDAAEGAALATAIAEYGTFFIGLWMVWRVLALRGISLAMLKTAWRGNIRTLLALNRDIMLRSLLLQLCFGALTVFGARLGPEIVAVNAVLMTLLTFTAYALDGFAYAVEAHSGQAYGARESGQLREVWRAACRQSGLVALVFALIYACLGEQIVALLTSLPSLRELASHYLFWQAILPVVGVWCYLLDGMFIGATRGAEMRNSMAVAAAGFGLTLLTLPYLGNHGLWLALAVFLALRGLSLAFIWHRHWRNNTWLPSRHDIS